MCAGLPFTLDPSGGGHGVEAESFVESLNQVPRPGVDWSDQRSEPLGRQLGVSMEGSQREQCALL